MGTSSARRLRLLYLGDPAAIHVQRWLRYFAAEGHQVHLLPYPDSFAFVPPEALPGVRVVAPGPLPRHLVHLHRALAPKLLLFANLLCARQAVRRWRVDLVHAHYLSGNAWIGMLTGFHPFVATAWGSDLNVDPYRSRVYRALTVRAARQADLLTANSQDLCRKLVALGADPSRVHLIQGGLELARFPFVRGNAALRDSLDLGPGPVVVSTRMLGAVYNLDIVVAAIPKVVAQVPEARFVFAYRGTPDQERALRELVTALGLEEVVRLLGPVDNAQIASLYHLAEVFVSVPSSEGMPGSLTEAMACGAVPVLSDLPYVREWIAHGRNGLVVPVRDAEALAEAIVWLLRHPRQRAAMARRNRMLVELKADHRVWMKRVEELYWSLLDQKALRT